MANLSLIEDLSLPITRQDLFNMLSTAQVGTIDRDELVPGMATIDVVDYLTNATTSPQPGQFLHCERERRTYCWHDEVEGTGVSLWLAIGPDRFDVACIANSPVPAGAVVQLYHDRWVGMSTGASGHVALQRAIGTCPAGLRTYTLHQTGTVFEGLQTQASGAWIPVSIDGIVFGITQGVVTRDRWIRVQDGTVGRIVQNTSGGVGPLRDDAIGTAPFQFIGSTTTPVASFFVWTGPRVINAL